MSSDGVTETDGEDATAEAEAGATETADERPDRVEFLLVTVGGTTQAVEVGRVVRVARDPPVTRVPRSPPHVQGVATVNGEVRAVVDAGALLGVDVRAEHPTLVVLDRDGSGQPFGIVVDDVVGIDPRPVDALCRLDQVDLPAGDDLYRASIVADEPIGVLDVEAIASAVSDRSDRVATRG